MLALYTDHQDKTQTIKQYNRKGGAALKAETKKSVQFKIKHDKTNLKKEEKPC